MHVNPSNTPSQSAENTPQRRLEGSQTAKFPKYEEPLRRKLPPPQVASDALYEVMHFCRLDQKSFARDLDIRPLHFKQVLAGTRPMSRYELWYARKVCTQKIVEAFDPYYPRTYGPERDWVDLCSSVRRYLQGLLDQMYDARDWDQATAKEFEYEYETREAARIRDGGHVDDGG